MSDMNYRNPSLAPEARAGLLINELSLDEKMAQVNCIFPFDKTYKDFDWIREQVPYGIGEVSTLEMRRIKTLEEAAEWQRKVQSVVMEQSPHNIPAIFHMEGLCGAFIQDTTSFPAGIGRGAGFDPELEEEIASIVSRQEAACGVTHILAPVLDISRDSRMGRQGETYGEDPALAASLGAAYARGIQSTVTAGRNPESVAKHFLAFHNSQGGIHGTHSDTPPRLLREVYAKPFQAAIQEGLKGVMPCYCSIDGEPASVSESLLTGLLREEMGFDGIAVSDYGGIGNSHTVHHIGETAAEAGLLALRAGMDIEMPSPAGYGEGLREMFESGEVDVSLLDRAVLRVLTAKFRMGLFENPFALKGAKLYEAVCHKEDREVSLRAARQSLVLLKNDGVLPLRRDIKRIAVIGPHADSPRKYFGGYTHMCMMESTYAIANSIAGVSGVVDSVDEIRTVPGTNIQSDEGPEFDEILYRQKPDCRSLIEELRTRIPDADIAYARGYHIAGSDQSGYAEALELVKHADVVILTLGGKHGTCSMSSMGEGVDAANINLPECQDVFIKEVAQYGKPVIGVHFDGRPISSDAADECLNAILEAWSPAECGAQAVADALMGDYNPGGKLPVSVAYHAGQIPIYYNHPYGSAWHQGESIGFSDYVDTPHTPRYHFGYGLSYSKFDYSNFNVSSDQITPDEELTISVDVCNISNYAGDEVVQLYVSDMYASRTRPVQELVGFNRVHLDPGEKKRVFFMIEPSQLAFLDRDMKWKIERGDFEFRIGGSSEDVRASAEVRISDNAFINGKKRAMYARVEVTETAD